MAIIDTKTTNINTIFLFIFIFEYLHYTHHLDLNANVPDIFPAPSTNLKYKTDSLTCPSQPARPAYYEN